MPIFILAIVALALGGVAVAFLLSHVFRSDVEAEVAAVEAALEHPPVPSPNPVHPPGTPGSVTAPPEA